MENNDRSVSQNANKPLKRQPSIKNKKPPEVRQTLTSKYRLLKANPILMCELGKNSNVDKEQLLKKPLTTLVKALDSNSQARLEKNPTAVDSRKKTPKNFVALNKSKVEIYSKPKSNLNLSNTTKIDFKSGQFLSSTVVENNRAAARKGSFSGAPLAKPASKSTGYVRGELGKPGTLKQIGAVPKQPKPSDLNKKPKNETKNPMRRSLSAQHLERKKKPNVKTQSLEELKPTNNQPRNCSPITEESSFKSAETSPALLPVIFKTPSVGDRRSMVARTPNTTNNRRSLFLSTPTAKEMSQRLNDWLKRRGKSLGGYHHLQCFGIHGSNGTRVTPVDTENKENIEAEIIPRSSSYEDLKIIITEPEKEVVNLESVAREALLDLHKLILDGYPGEQCDAWLKLIKQKHKKLEEEPQYWECRAALEQSRGNINLAVECYKTAIVQGAEIQTVDQSLDQLLQKFSLLDISKGEMKETKERARIVRDARNIFKSSIIQFAVQERTLRKKNKDGVTVEKKLVATPVRRSTRLSRSAYTSTPQVKIYSSLQEVSSPVRNSMSFQHNCALID